MGKAEGVKKISLFPHWLLRKSIQHLLDITKRQEIGKAFT